MNGSPSPVSGADTVIEAFRDNVARIPQRPALRRRVGPGWETLTWSEYGVAVDEVAAGLIELGIAPGERAAILSGNRVEWHLADVGALSAAAVTVPVYPTNSAEQVGYILRQSGSRLCFVENEELLAKVLEIRDEAPKLDRVVVFEDGGLLDDPFILEFGALRSLGAARLRRQPGAVVERTLSIDPDQLATLVYTSGTTGPPKGAMLSHANIMWTIRSVASVLPLHSGERFLSFLPLSHVAERGMSELAPIAIGGETWFARSLASVAEDLVECRPTVFFAVPRVWEKLQSAVLEKIAEQPRFIRGVAHRYLAFGMRAELSRQQGCPLRRDEFVHHFIDGVLGSRIRREMGLDQAHILITAAAPIDPTLVRWLHAIGLPVVELYGQTEVCGPTSCNPPADNRVGTVGRPLPGVEVRLADDEEILVRGGNVCLGYFDDQAATAELLDADGWMHSGDLGTLDEDGYLHLTGRKKDLIITAAGQNVAPQEIEMQLRAHPLISEAVVVGEGRRYLTALIALDADALDAWAHEHNKLGEFEALTADPDLRSEIEAAVDAVNARHARVEGVRKHRILPRGLTTAAGELTPTLKIRRAVVCEANRDLIEDMYAEDG
jgi:long-chain acyl-CoA synthetase